MLLPEGVILYYIILCSCTIMCYILIVSNKVGKGGWEKQCLKECEEDDDVCATSHNLWSLVDM